jgi:predicted DCC family thiol-disulfide oxidoreductase YuxK
MGAVVLFDGVCNFCDASVNFIIEHDRKGYFQFAPLQSEAGRKLGEEHGLRSETVANSDDYLVPIDSVILVEDGEAYTHSTAALRIAKHLDGLWSLFYGLIVIPAPVRDFLYKVFARYRYRMFGRKDECMLPSADVRARFLT